MTFCPSFFARRQRHRGRFSVMVLAPTMLGLSCLCAQAQNSATAIGGFLVITGFIHCGERNSTSYLDLEGSGQGSFANFSVLDFSASAFNLTGGTVNGIQNNTLSLTLTQSNFASSTSGPFEVYLTTNNTVSIAGGSSALRYQHRGCRQRAIRHRPAARHDGSGQQSATAIRCSISARRPYTTAAHHPELPGDTYTLTLSAAAMQATSPSNCQQCRRPTTTSAWCSLRDTTPPQPGRDLSAGADEFLSSEP